MVRLILTVSQIFFFMDSRIIEFLRSDNCENIATVNVVKSGVSVGEVWGALSLDERLSFLDQCEDVLHLCYSDVEHWDYATLMGYFDAYRLQRVSGGGATDGNTKDGEMPIVFLLVGEGKSYENTLRAMGEYNGIYYELNGNVFAVSENRLVVRG